MKKTLLVFGLVLLVGVNVAFAHEADFALAKQLVDSGVGCDKLTDEQLAAIGDYYMEQMHPGEAHEMMHKMMGGEDSESVKQMHIQMAKGIYCNESTTMGKGGMMGCGMMGGGMMSSGMMPMMDTESHHVSKTQERTTSAGMTGMMGNWGYDFGFSGFLNVLYVVLLVGLVLLVYLWGIKLVKEVKGKRNKK